MKALFSRKCEYGLLSVLYLATKSKGEVVSVEEISASLKIPKEFVSKVLQSLSKGEILGSKKGKSGGFYLIKSTKKIKLLDIILAVDGKDLFESCVIGFPKCDKDSPCPVHSEWKIARENIKKLFSKHSIDKLKSDFIKKIEMGL